MDQNSVPRECHLASRINKSYCWSWTKNALKMAQQILMSHVYSASFWSLLGRLQFFRMSKFLPSRGVLEGRHREKFNWRISVDYDWMTGTVFGHNDENTKCDR